MSAVRDMLEQEVTAYERLGFPALLQRFVLKHGVELHGSKLPKGVRLGKPKMCFKNATELALLGRGDYHEGYVLCKGLPIALLHAWTVEDGKVLDPTLKDAESCTYFGVRFDRTAMLREQFRNGVYGLLEPWTVNVEFLRKIDPALVVEALGKRSVKSVNSEGSC